MKSSSLLSILFVAILLATAGLIAALLSKGGIEHNLAGLPHWTTSCPEKAEAILVIGQSQASNTGPRRHISFSGSRAFLDGKCYYLRDPMPGTAGRGGTIWPEFADNLERRVVIADIAISGSAIEEWTAPDQIAKIRQTLADLSAAGYPDPLIVWMQGETNGARRTSASVYYEHLKMLLRVAPTKRWLITRESICYDKQRKWHPLDVARDKIANEFVNVKIGPDLDTMGIERRQSDRCHLTSKGQTDLASRLSKSAAPLLNR